MSTPSCPVSCFGESPHPTWEQELLASIDAEIGKATTRGPAAEPSTRRGNCDREKRADGLRRRLVCRIGHFVPPGAGLDPWPRSLMSGMRRNWKSSARLAAPLDKATTN